MSKKDSQRKWYLANKARHIDNVKKRSQESRLANRDFMFDYLLSHPCVDCGESDPIVLEFDHIAPESKEFCLSSSVDYSLQKLIEEIKKCEVRCANCHRRKTAKQFGYFRYLRSFNGEATRS